MQEQVLPQTRDQSLLLIVKKVLFCQVQIKDIAEERLDQLIDSLEYFLYQSLISNDQFRFLLTTFKNQKRFRQYDQQITSLRQKNIELQQRLKKNQECTQHIEGSLEKQISWKTILVRNISNFIAIIVNGIGVYATWVSNQGNKVQWWIVYCLLCMAACYFFSIIINDIVLNLCCRKYVPFDKTAPKTETETKNLEVPKKQNDVGKKQRTIQT